MLRRFGWPLQQKHRNSHREIRGGIAQFGRAKPPAGRAEDGLAPPKAAPPLVITGITFYLSDNLINRKFIL
jgi:hypothetical protein